MNLDRLLTLTVLWLMAGALVLGGLFGHVLSGAADGPGEAILLAAPLLLLIAVLSGAAVGGICRWHEARRGPPRDDPALREAAREPEAPRVAARPDPALMRALSRFASATAHDLNNLLTPVLGYAELIEVALDNPERVREYVREIQAAGERVRECSRRLALVGRDRLHTARAVDVSDLVRRHADEIARTPDAALAVTLELDARELFVWGDVEQLLELLRNLTDNARAAMRAGGTLRLRARGLPAGDTGRPERIELAVEDTGAGIGAESLVRLFEPHAGMRQKRRGRGLGLAIVAGVVRRHHGAVEVTSSEGRGTTVVVTLPAAPADVAAQAGRAAPLDAPPAFEGTRERAAGSARVPQA